MYLTTRQTRSQTRSQTKSQHPSAPTTLDSIPLKPRLSRDTYNALVQKHKWLQSNPVALPAQTIKALKDDQHPAGASLAFVLSEAGTAVCISPSGILLTCAHCISEAGTQTDIAALHHLIFSSGVVVVARTIAWDPHRDLALLIITEPSSSWPYIPIASSPPTPKTPIFCIGHPGSEDLEAAEPGKATNYGTLVLSTGVFRGLSPGQDVQDNSDIGALMHDCWTYWGHSGAGLFERASGRLVGLHSSWDEDSGMRRGVALEAIVSFLDEFEKTGDGKGKGLGLLSR